MYKWRKIGQIFSLSDQNYSIPNKPEWMHRNAQCPSTVIFDDKIRFYFCTRNPPDAQNRTISRLAYVDFSRDHQWRPLKISQLPVIPLGQRGCFDEFGTYPASVIQLDNKIHLYHGGITRCESVPFDVSIGTAISTDGGENFTKYGTGPVLSATMDEPFLISSPKIRYFNNKFHLFYIAGVKWINTENGAENVYKIRHAESDDGLKWQRSGRYIIQDKLGEDECQASPDVFYANGKFHMFYCYRQALNFRENKNSTYRIGYASGKNLIDWVRDDDRAGLTTSPTGWDAEMVSYPHVFRLDEKIYMAYQGNGFGRDGFGLAELQGELD